MEMKSVQNYQNVVTNNASQPVEQPAFAGKRREKVNMEEVPDSFEMSEAKVPTGKKIGLGVASYLLPGLGQFINGDNKKGLALLGTGIVAKKCFRYFNKKADLVYPAKTINMLGHKIEMPGVTLKGKGKIPAAIFAIVMLGTNIWSIVDAVKKAKPDAKA